MAVRNLPAAQQQGSAFPPSPAGPPRTTAELLRGKIATVVGASKGLGRAIALGLAREGADLVVVARSPSLLHELAVEATALGQRCIPIVADARDGHHMKNVADWVADEFGGLDILVHAAGGSLGTAGLERPALWEQLNREKGLPFWEIADDVFDACVTLDLRTVFLSCKYLAPLMIAQGSGSIIVLGSYAGITGNRGWKDAVYQATKGGVHAFVAAIASELAPYNVAANVLLPGLTRTPTTEAYPAVADRADQMPDDCVPAALFLAAQDREGITGRFLEANQVAARLPAPFMPITQVLSRRAAEPGSIAAPAQPADTAPYPDAPAAGESSP